MGSRNAPTSNLLADKGSLFDLVAMFIVLLGGDKNIANQVYNMFMEFLDKGYTYHNIKTEILRCFYDSKQKFRWDMFNKPKSDNLIKQDQIYYHNELKIINKPHTVDYDVDQGTIVSREQEYFVARVASYTLQEFTKYFYEHMPIDIQANPPKKMSGIFKYKINQYGIDKLLFMVDIMSEDLKSKNMLFNIGQIDDYSCKVEDYIHSITDSFPNGINYYIPRKRRIFE